jgi:glyoxylase-like metal-dependent hydrolase (beta-lactamase superfamily II)
MLSSLFEVAEGVYRVPARAANTYLVEGTNGLALVDTGLPGSEKRIYNALQKLERKPEDVKLVLITHRHLDHIGSAAALKHGTGATLVAHQFEKPYIAGTLMVRAPTAWSLKGKVIRRVMGFTQWTMKLLRIIKYQPIYVDKTSDDDFLLDGVGLDGSIVWTPGHTKGSLSLFLNKQRVALVGDLLRGGHGKLVEPLFMESIQQTQASVQRLLELGPDLICPGHGKPQPSSAVKMRQRMVAPVVEKKKEAEEDLDKLTSDLFKTVPND